MYIQNAEITLVKPAKSANDLISTNERVMVEARKKYYENTNNKKIVQTGQYIGLQHFT